MLNPHPRSRGEHSSHDETLRRHPGIVIGATLQNRLFTEIQPALDLDTSLFHVADHPLEGHGEMRDVVARISRLDLLGQRGDLDLDCIIGIVQFPRIGIPFQRSQVPAPD